MNATAATFALITSLLIAVISAGLAARVEKNLSTPKKLDHPLFRAIDTLLLLSTMLASILLSALSTATIVYVCLASIQSLEVHL